MVIVVDNYDSFTYNLVQYLGELGCEVRVLRNDAVSVDDIAAAAPRAIVISPGPGRPDDAGISMDVVRRLGPTFPVLGVCLGHQCIGQVYGGRIGHARALMHGKTSDVHHGGIGVFEGLETPLTATRYHSLAVERESLPGCLEVTAWTEDGEIMGLRHREVPVEGVQFHPESILTQHGRAMLGNFLDSV